MTSRDGSEVKILGRRLLAYRLHEGLTQPELGTRIGVSRFSISRLENGIKLSVKNLYRIRIFLEAQRGSHE